MTAWEDPPRVDRTDAAPVLAVDGFEGPLDWWLEMARAQKIDLAKLSIATLIGAFATAMDAALARRAGRSAGALGGLDGDGGDAHRTLVTAAAAARRAGGTRGVRRSRGAAPAVA